jgi:hypothetical protein
MKGDLHHILNSSPAHQVATHCLEVIRPRFEHDRVTAGCLDHRRFMFQATMRRLLRQGDHAIEWIGSAG